MLFMSSANRIIRIHGPYISEKEIEKITSVLRAQGEPDYIEDITMFFQTHQITIVAFLKEKGMSCTMKLLTL